MDLPKTLQFHLFGNNQNGDELSNMIVIEFTNDCQSYPVIQEGHSAGWVTFVSLSLKFPYYVRHRIVENPSSRPFINCLPLITVRTFSTTCRALQCLCTTIFKSKHDPFGYSHCYANSEAIRCNSKSKYDPFEYSHSCTNSKAV